MITIRPFTYLNEDFGFDNSDHNNYPLAEMTDDNIELSDDMSPEDLQRVVDILAKELLFAPIKLAA